MEREPDKEPKPDGGPAFPIPGHNYTNSGGTIMAINPRFGMSLRDYFAGQALAGARLDGASIIANGDQNSDAIAHARAAYRYADAMIEARGEE